MTGAVSVRPVRPDDWADWRTARQRSLTEDPQAFASSATMWTGDNDTEARWRARLGNGDACFLARVGETPVGMVAGAPTVDGVELISMWVAAGARRRGIGRRLIEHVVAWAGGRPVRLRVIDGNHAAIGAYAARGFVLDPAPPDGENCRTMTLAAVSRGPVLSPDDQADHPD